MTAVTPACVRFRLLRRLTLHDATHRPSRGRTSHIAWAGHHEGALCLPIISVTLAQRRTCLTGTAMFRTTGGWFASALFFSVVSDSQGRSEHARREGSDHETL